jgi:hypothetical protein
MISPLSYHHNTDTTPTPHLKVSLRASFVACTRQRKRRADKWRREQRAEERQRRGRGKGL